MIISRVVYDLLAPFALCVAMIVSLAINPTSATAAKDQAYILLEFGFKFEGFRGEEIPNSATFAVNFNGHAFPMDPGIYTIEFPDGSTEKIWLKTGETRVFTRRRLPQTVIKTIPLLFTKDYGQIFVVGRLPRATVSVRDCIAKLTYWSVSGAYGFSSGGTDLQVFAAPGEYILKIDLGKMGRDEIKINVRPRKNTRVFIKKDGYFNIDYEEQLSGIFENNHAVISGGT